ncbi:MAG: hypothetical protein BGO68_01435 [Candidatus Amoebophilus sp. 36-38]|nr:MAG: hypothetical protein BGO68_01435 [Candidatus Amoebophilus sp. 36-38]
MHTSHTFLEEVVQELYSKHEADIANSTIILPNKKGVEIFQQIVRKRSRKTNSLPQVLTLESWILDLSKMKLASTLDLLILLYETFQKHHFNKESFERFYGWGAMLLQDFDIIDKCLVDPKKLFANLYEQKVLTLPDEYLTEAQQEAIKSFWKTFETRLSSQQQDFLQLWKVLPQVYDDFTTQLLKDNIGYLGLCYRKIYDNLEVALLANYERLFIVGFNALHPAEEKLFAWFHRHIPTEFYWDVDAYYMNDENQEAGYYLREHQEKSYFQASFKHPFPARIQTEPKKIIFFESNTLIGQAQIIGTRLQQLVEEQGNNFKPNQVVIVLADEALLLPMLHALPSRLQSVSTTLGYPITHTASYRIIEQLLALQVAIRQPTCPAGYFPSQSIIGLLQQTPIKYYNQELATQTIQSLIENYSRYIPQKVLTSLSELYQLLFKCLLPGANITQYFIDIISLLTAELGTKEDLLLPLEKQALTQLQEEFSQLQQSVGLLLEVDLDSFTKLFRQLIQPIRLPLNQKSSLDGIQLMRIWETANLDFEHVFILGMNEGNLPANRSQGSFIPYNLRKGYGLPTLDTFQASLDAYYFYRLLQRAKQVYITYGAPSGANNQKEMSRYLWQLLYESHLPIEKHHIPASVYTPTIHPIVIQKDKAILEKLEEFVVRQGEITRTLTPAALNTYMDCSLKFYFCYILELKIPSKPVVEDTGTIRFGSLFHEVMEKLYASLQLPNQPAVIQIQDMIALKKQVRFVIAQTLAKNLYHDHDLQWKGEHLIEQEVLQKVINRVLVVDEKYAPFILVGLELGKQERLIAYFKLKGGRIIALRGIIDRVDLKEDTIRVIDYKTGSDEKYVDTIKDLFDRDQSKRKKAIFQTLLYAWILKKDVKYAAYKIMPGIMNTRSIFEPNFDPRVMVKQETDKEGGYIADITDYQDEFEAELAILLEEILDPHTPFIQTNNLLYCTTCPYNRICQRY